MSLLNYLTVAEIERLTAAVQEYAYHRCFHGPRSADAERAALRLYYLARECIPDWNFPPESWAERWLLQPHGIQVERVDPRKEPPPC